MIITYSVASLLILVWFFIMAWLLQNNEILCFLQKVVIERAFSFATFSPIPFEVWPLAAVPIKNIRLFKILPLPIINLSASKKLYI